MIRSERPDIAVCNSSRKFQVREVFRVVFYFDKSHQDIIHQIHDVIIDFVGLVSLDAFGYYYDMQGEAQEISQTSFSTLMESWFSGLYSEWPNATIELDGHDYLAPEFGLRYWGKLLNTIETSEETGFLNVWMSRSFFLNNSVAVDDFFRRTLMKVSVVSGYTNLALVGGNINRKQALANRYFGLDIAEPESVSIDLGMRCSGSYWMTYLGVEQTKYLGGFKIIQNSLEIISNIEELSGGVLIKLTAEPELGDRNKKEEMIAYEVFARFLDEKECLHIPEKSVYFEDKNGFSDLEAQEKWHRRFLSLE